MRKLLLLTGFLFFAWQMQAQAQKEATKKWNPGHYLYGANEATTNSLKWVWEKQIYSDNFAGIVLGFYWEDLEKVKSNYDFSDIEAELEKVRNLNAIHKTNKKIILAINTGYYNYKITDDNDKELDDSSVPPGPEYLRNDSEYEGGFMHTQKGKWLPKYWLDSIRDRVAALVEALGEAFDDEELIEVMLLRSESALGGNEDAFTSDRGCAFVEYCEKSLNSEGYTRQAFVEATDFVNRVAVKAWPNTNVMKYLNFISSDNERPRTNTDEYMQILADSLLSYGGGLGSPDMRPLFNNQKEERDKIIPSFKQYKLKKGQMPLLSAVSTEIYAGGFNNQSGNYWPADTIINYAINTLGLNYMLWLKNENQSTTITDVVNTLDSLRHANDSIQINTGIPSNIRRTESPTNCTASIDFNESGKDRVSLRCNDEQLIVKASSSETGELEYNWDSPSLSNVSTNDSVELLELGYYYVYITSISTGCVAKDSILVLDKSYPNLSLNTPNNITCISPEAELVGISTNGNAKRNYIWSGPNVSLNETDSNITVTQEGIYSLKVSFAFNNCSTSKTVFVSADTSAPQVPQIADQTLACNGGKVVLDGNTREEGVNYAWFDSNENNISTEATVSLNEAGAYLLKITASNGCSSSVIVNITQESEFELAPITQEGNLDCSPNGSVVNLFAETGFENYIWRDANNTVLQNGPSESIPVSEAGEYTVEVSNDNCTATQSIVVNANNDNLEVEINVSDIIKCNTPEVSLSASNNNYNSYKWVRVKEPELELPSTPSIMVSQGGNYTLTAESGACTASATVNVKANLGKPENVNAGTDKVLECNNNSKVILQGSTSTNNTMYSWSGPGIVTGGNTATPTVNQEGTYTLTVTKNYNGCSETDNVDVILNTIEANIQVNGQVFSGNGKITCTNSTLELSTFENFDNYLWVGTPNSVNQNQKNSRIITISKGGSYTITANSGRCSSQATKIVDVDKSQPNANAGNDQTIATFGNQTTTLTAAFENNVSYTWRAENGSTFGIIGNPNRRSITVDETGIYTVTVTKNSNGCSESDDAEVTQVLFNTSNDNPEIKTNALSKTGSNIENNNTITPVIKTNGLANQSDSFGNYNKLNIYPNPTSTTITIAFGENAPQTKITIMNALGQIVVKANAKEKESIEMDLSSLPKGVYQIVVSNQKHSKIMSLIKN